eukprot:gene22951-4003_t
MLLHLLLLILLVDVVGGSTGTCEKRDGDCPPCKYPGMLSPTAILPLSAAEPDLVASAKQADAVITQLGNQSTIERFDDPSTGLHTSIFYFCCHTLPETVKMGAALDSMQWNSFEVVYDTFGCNLDHDNKTVYLHGMPRNQTGLFNLAASIEQALITAGVPIHHPRKSLFHMTLARVTPQFPADAAAARLNATYFGKHRLCSFTYNGKTITADDCK